MKKLVAAAAAIPAAALTVYTVEMYRNAFCRNRGWLIPYISRNKPKGHGEDYYICRDAASARLAELPSERLYICSERGDRLCGWYYKSGAEYSRKIAVIIHGYRSNHLENGGLYYEYYLSRGIDVFMADNTACGESEGKFIGYDCYEWRDSLRWLEYLQSRFGKDIELILHGFSMGGATVLKLSDKVPDCVKFIIDDCGFSSAQELLKHSLGKLYQPLRLANRIIAGYDLEDSDVRENLKNAKVPILFFHGTEDKLVPYFMGPALYELCPTEKQAHFVEGAKHVESCYVDPEGYAAAIDGFVEKYM